MHILFLRKGITHAYPVSYQYKTSHMHILYLVKGKENKDDVWRVHVLHLPLHLIPGCSGSLRTFRLLYCVQKVNLSYISVLNKIYKDFILHY